LRRTSLAITQVRIRQYRYFCVTCPKLGGGRTRRFFRDKKEAQTYFEQCRIQQQNYGTAALSISNSVRIEALECHEKLEATGHTLREATEFFLAHERKINGSCPVDVAVRELLRAREMDGCSKRYLGDLRVRLERFAADFDCQALASVTSPAIDDWLRALPVGGVTRNTFRRRLSALFGYARKRGYVQVNPIEDVERAKERYSPIGILTVEETERLLRNAQPEMLPFWAVGAFAGLRTAEIQRLSWDEIDLLAGFIEVKAEKSKTANRRLVTIPPNLRKWLAPFRRSNGPVTPTNFQSRAKHDRDCGGLSDRWPNNALRHSFASYHLAVFNDAAKLALEMGNSPRIIFAHYRELVRPSDATRYWSIQPGAHL
jgi:integrase